jgi:carboxymethylenebutenolidase
VEVPLVAIVGFRHGKVAFERIYWDQGSVLKQIGLLKDAALPVFGAETARKVLEQSGGQAAGAR